MATNKAFYEGYLMDKAKMAKAKSAALPKTAIIPEEGPDGQKRLYKVRYEELEQKYRTLNDEKEYWLKNYEAAMSESQKYMKAYKEKRDECDTLRVKVVDSEAVTKKIQQLIKELKLPMDMAEYRTTDGALQAFFGLIYTQIRTPQEDADVLAD